MIEGKIPEGETAETVEARARILRAALLEALRGFVTPRVHQRGDLFLLARYALGRIEKINLSGKLNSHDALDAQLVTLTIASVLALLEGPAIVDDPDVLREQLLYHAKRLMKQSTTYVKETL